jgi:hypothetical protein
LSRSLDYSLLSKGEIEREYSCLRKELAGLNQLLASRVERLRSVGPKHSRCFKVSEERELREH